MTPSFKKLSPKIFDFCKILEIHKKIVNLRSFFVLVLYCTNLQIVQLKFEIEGIVKMQGRLIAVA